MLTLSALKNRREAILTCAERHGAISLHVFGSVSRGEAKGGSDVDFLVRFQANRSLLDIVGLAQELTTLLGTKVDVVDETGLPSLLRDRVLQDAVPL